MKLTVWKGLPRLPELVDLGVQGFELDLRSPDPPGDEPLRSAEYPGLNALMLAVLEDGIRSYFAQAGRTRSEAEAWIASDRRQSPFAFPVVCDTLGVRPSAVRGALARMRNTSRSRRWPPGRSRQSEQRADQLPARKSA